MQPDTATVECFAQRLLSPFRGTMQVIRHAAAEAVSLDGVHWDIYVANDSLLDGLGDPARVQVSDIRYGAWSAARGLKRGPLYPSADFRRMEAMGAVVYAHLLRVHERVPFPLRDRHECWLLDRDSLPLALLQSAVDTPGREVAPAWMAGRAAHERFAAPGLAPGEAATALEEKIRDLAGPAPSARWYRRDATGCGEPCDARGGARLQADDFPALPLRTAFEDATTDALVDAYHAWQAVWLLCLPVGPELRRRLEGRARHQAELVEPLHRLYPEIIDAAALNAARVEARLLGSLAVRAPEPDAASTFYIELNPEGGGYN